MSFLNNEQMSDNTDLESMLYSDAENADTFDYEDFSDDLMDYVEPSYSEGQGIDYGFN
ncbi:hypothetical protein [Thalassotalea atypica]|uniref:hypothetical protein n=1 Tax=Thalassotalea atypica TaxID=2054316 RepID=UPI0025730528|nr:hypothetical protein [Thalassotalea atypica]